MLFTEKYQRDSVTQKLYNPASK